MAAAACPWPGHDGSKVVRDGKYGKAGHRRQRYRCYPPNGDPWHRFTPTLPRQMTVSGLCDECERHYGPDEGPCAPRHYDFTIRHAGWALVQVGDGRSYRRVGAEIRRRAGREWTREDTPVWSPHPRLLEDWIEVFAPVLWAAFAPMWWPEVVVFDRVPFRLRNRETIGKGGPSGVAFNVFAALGYPTVVGAPSGATRRLHAPRRRTGWVFFAPCRDGPATSSAMASRPSPRLSLRSGHQPRPSRRRSSICVSGT